MDIILLLPIIFPVLVGILIACLPVLEGRRAREIVMLIALVAEVGLVLACGTGDYRLELFRMSDRLVFELRPDGLSMLFGVLSAVMWLASAVYAADYMKHDPRERFYQVFCQIAIGVIVALCFSANLVTMYLFYEMMTLVTLPMVIHDRTKAAVNAGWQYLLYSMGGAFLGLAALFIFYHYGLDMGFDAAGRRQSAVLLECGAAERDMIFVGCFLAIVGFGSKAGLFPLHGWLPVAHPVAPAPASALLSGNVTKMGVLFIIRIIYYVAGAELLRGSWVQHAFLALAMVTIFMGSMLASREKLLKRRLAYSTISQVSYCLFGVALMNPTALCGALMHVVFHSLAKNALFLSAGTIIHETGHTATGELKGIGRQLPVTLWLFTLVSLTLIGIPPTSAFLSKWYLAEGALESGVPVIWYLGPVVLLISAVLTAAYLLPIAVNGFFPGTGQDSQEGQLPEAKRPEAPLKMLIPVLLLTAAALLFGMFPGRLLGFISSLCGQVL